MSQHPARPFEQVEPAPESQIGGPYARYVLAVLVLVYVFNFIDRQILSILAEEIKRDLGLSDAQLGFLYGTVFAVFYAVFGIPLGRLADVWTRRSLISVGLAFWSGMTALSGIARSFGALATFRIGVGVGEASATPAAFSMLSDYFPPERRATALATYSSGVYIGAGLGIFLGGWIVDAWTTAYPAGDAPFGLKGWHVAFFAVGLPGLLMAVWVRSLREPLRGVSEGLVVERHPEPFREFGRELIAVFPGLTFLNLSRLGGPRALVANTVAAGALALTAWAFTALLGTPEQWIALAVGVYAAVSWIQGLRLRDRPTFALIFQSRALLYSATGFSFLAFSGYGVAFWTPPFFLRQHGVSTAEAGTILGLTAAIAGWAGVTIGGVASDALRRHTPNGRLWVGLFTATVPVPFVYLLLTAQSTTNAYAINAFVGLFAGMWIGPAASTVNDLVLPRMRAMASATYILFVTFVGLALGPYTIGRISVALGDDLQSALLLSLLVFIPAIALLLLATRHLEREESTRLERARAAGEQGLPPIGG
jgi:MFS family permease